MVRAAALALVLLASSAQAEGQQTVNIADWAAKLPQHFVVTGVKTEPTYLAAIEIRRDGDRFSVLGGAPAWAERSLQAVRVTADGALCEAGGPCAFQAPPSGFLATAGLLAALRQHALSGKAPVASFGDRKIVCIAGERLGIDRPILDPCFDLASGAAIAQRHRLSGRFDGPTLEASSLRISLPSIAAAAHQEDFRHGSRL